MIEIKVHKDDAAREAAAVALRSALYIPGWQLSKWLQRVKIGNKSSTIALAYKDGKPVAVVLVRAGDGLTAAFCRKSERRQGIASKCIAEIRAAGVEPREADEGIEGSSVFWQKNNVARTYF